ncbi:glycosyltransferase [Haloferax profundi]|uniref:glycosyltransferase n=1 Tax=Haloferax profundi TaxID=1544718 RepID=UPI0009E6E5CB|nr:glycosyltransferase [Haloferax profundi]
MMDIGASFYQVVRAVIVFGTIFFGVIWTLTNFYNYFPLAQRFADRVFERVSRRVFGQSADREAERVDSRDGQDRHTDTDELPSMAILVPAYEEAEVVANSIQSIFEAVYPSELLSVMVLVEPDDVATRDVLDRLSKTYPFETVVVPADYPGESNKPRALNYGFEFVESDVVGVVDAEVIIGASLLEEAGHTLVSEADFALSHLDMVNEDDGWLNLLFRAEYSYWYNLVIPSFEHVGYPIPLGGTSCFFRRGVLEDVSDARIEADDSPWSTADRQWLSDRGLAGYVPWDPSNVTEDFELGLNLWTKDYEFAFLDAVTNEESPIELKSWIEQRTRWKKGKVYTFVQYLDRPPETLRQRFHIYWQSLLPHLGPINIAGLLFVFWLTTMTGAVPSALVKGILSLGLTFLVLVAGLYARGYWIVSDKPLPQRLQRTCIVALSLFFYWIFQWLADVRAILQTYRGQFHWTKTAHLGRNLSEPDLGRGIRPTDITVSLLGTDANDSLDISASAASVDRTIPRKKRLGALAVVLVVAMALRIGALTRWSLWLDEIYTVTFRAAVPIGELLVIPWDPHPPLYFVLLRLWMSVAGQTQFGAGLFSVVFSVATVGMVYLLAGRLYDDLTGLVAASLVTVSTMHIHFGRTIRMYSLLTFLILASWYTYLHLPERNRWSALTYLVVTIAMLYTHVYAVFVLLAQHGYTLLTESSREFKRRWIALQVAVSLLYLPWVYVLSQQVLGQVADAERAGTAISWIPAPSTELLRDTFLMFAGFPSYYPIFNDSWVAWGAALVVLLTINVTIMFAIVNYEPADDGRIEYHLVDLGRGSLLAMFFIVPIAVPFVLSYVLFPIYFPRYALAASLPLLVLVARGLVNLEYQPMWRAVFSVVLVAGAITTGVGYYAGDTVEDWDGSVSDVSANISPDDLLVIQPFWVENDVTYYYGGPAVERMMLPASPDVTATDRSLLATKVSDHETVWVVRYQTDDSDGVLGTLNQTHDLRYTREDELISVYRFERASR